MDDLSQYKDLYLQTSREYLQSLNDSLVGLEKDPRDFELIDNIFRSAHSLKSQSAAMGYLQTGYLCHAVEDIFYEIKNSRLALKPELADLLFKAFDSLEKSISKIEKESVEIDLTEQIDQLKNLTGVQTQGAGKSVRNENQAQSVEKKVDVIEELPKVETPAKKQSPSIKNQQKDPTEIAKPESNGRTDHVEIKTIPVKVTLLDDILDRLEEMIVYRLELKKIAEKLNNSQLSSYFSQTDKLLDAMQYQIMKARAVPVKMVLDHFPRAVRDLAREENKEIDLEIVGEDLELDRAIVDRLDEPLIHLVRNAVSHGIEKKGKIKIAASQFREFGIIEVSDDGLGIDWDALAKKANLTETSPQILNEALFSGISTSSEVTQISGRGVGLTVVKKTIENLGGVVEVESKKGSGTKFTLKLPLSMAIIKALLVLVGDERFAIPVSTIDRIVNVTPSQIIRTADVEGIVYENLEIPIVRLKTKLKLGKKEDETANQTVVVTVIDDSKVGLVVDNIFDSSDVIIKPLPEIIKNNEFYSGVTNLGDGQTALILNPRGLLTST